MEKELKECPDRLCEAEVFAKWFLISDAKDISFVASMIAGVSAKLCDTVDAIVKMSLQPIETLKVLKDLFMSGGVLAILAQSYVERINKMEEEYEKAGVSDSFNADLELGKLLTELVSLVDGEAELAKGEIKLIEKALAKFFAKTESAPANTEKEITQSIGKMSDEVLVIQYFGQEKNSC